MALTAHQLIPPSTGANQALSVTEADNSYEPQGGDTYTCDSGIAVRDAVYLSSDDTVAKADADDETKQPLIGFVVSKPTSTSCIVKYSGELGGFTGLTIGVNQYLSETPGEITTTAPTASGSIVQKVGFARNSTTLVIFVDRDYIVN